MSIAMSCRRRAMRPQTGLLRVGGVLLALLVQVAVPACAVIGWGPRVDPVGYRITATLSSVDFGSASAGEEGKTFVVVALDVSAKVLIPSEAEYRSKGSKAKRERCRSYNPERFTLILADGRRFLCSAMTSDSDRNWFGSSYREGGPQRETEGISVAAIVDVKDARSPFKIQLDTNAPIPVPDRRLGD